jgi:hypothetical protein
MRDSFEEVNTLANKWEEEACVTDTASQRIIQVQDSKRDLAGILLNPPNKEQGQAEPGSGRLEVCNM